MTEYTITVEANPSNPDQSGVDIVTVSNPSEAVRIIKEAQKRGCSVIYTGDPFADRWDQAVADVRAEFPEATPEDIDRIARVHLGL